MRTLGMLGGMSWESTALYYRALNQGVRQRLGGLHSAPLLIDSLDFAPVANQQQAGDWAGLADALSQRAQRLEEAGAKGLLLATNTMHLVADRLCSALTIPLLHIVDPTAKALVRDGFKRPLLLGTAFTMERDFYTGRLRHLFGLSPLVPPADDRAQVHRVIYEELCQGTVSGPSRAAYQAIMTRAAREQGADAVILGCTEITLLIGPQDSPLPLFDTTALHAAAAVDWIVGATSTGADSIACG